MRIYAPVLVLILCSTSGFSSGATAQDAAPRLLTPAAFSELDYPLGALANNAQGRVVLDVSVSETGIISEARIATSTESELLDRASIRVAKGSWRFEPARRNGQVVASTAQVEAVWTLPLSPAPHAYIEIPDQAGASAPVPDGPYLARYSDYPPSAAVGGSQSVVGLRYQVDAQGNVTDAVVVTPSDNARFNEAALRIARNRSFTPAMRNGAPVSAWQSLTVSFAVLPANAASRPPPCFQQPILARDAVLIGTTPYRVEIWFDTAKYRTRWETRQVEDWLGTWVRVAEDGSPQEVLLYTDDGWMVPSQPIANILTRDREYPAGSGGCWFYDPVSILG